MIEKIIRIFFNKEEKTNNTKILTVIPSNREIRIERSIKKIPFEKTELSGYFKNNTGLNLKERLYFLG